MGIEEGWEGMERRQERRRIRLTEWEEGGHFDGKRRGRMKGGVIGEVEF